MLLFFDPKWRQQNSKESWKVDFGLTEEANVEWDDEPGFKFRNKWCTFLTPGRSFKNPFKQAEINPSTCWERNLFEFPFLYNDMRASRVSFGSLELIFSASLVVTMLLEQKQNQGFLRIFLTSALATLNLLIFSRRMSWAEQKTEMWQDGVKSISRRREKISSSIKLHFILSYDKSIWTLWNGKIISFILCITIFTSALQTASLKLRVASPMATDTASLSEDKMASWTNWRSTLSDLGHTFWMNRILNIYS